MSKHNGYTDSAIAPRPGLAPAPAPVVVYRDRGGPLAVLTAALQLAAVLTLGLLVLPALWESSARLEVSRQALEDRETKAVGMAQTLAKAQQQLAVQQATLGAAQAQTRQIAEDNLRLAREIHDRLRE